MIAGLDVACPSCAGRSHIDPEHRGYPQWACPFCGALNPMLPVADQAAPVPAAPGPILVPARSRGSRATVAATAAAVAVTVLALVARAGIDRGDYRTVAGLAAVLAERDLPCRSIVLDPAPPPAVRESATCMIRASAVRILTFGSAVRRDRFLSGMPAGVVAAGRTWLILPDDARLAPAVASAAGGRVIRRGDGPADPAGPPSE